MFIVCLRFHINSYNSTCRLVLVPEQKSCILEFKLCIWGGGPDINLCLSCLTFVWHQLTLGDHSQTGGGAELPSKCTHEQCTKTAQTTLLGGNRELCQCAKLWAERVRRRCKSRWKVFEWRFLYATLCWAVFSGQCFLGQVLFCKVGGKRAESVRWTSIKILTLFKVAGQNTWKHNDEDLSNLRTRE